MQSPRVVRGFTLIELLIVIAIIAILSATILVSLNTARNKGANTAIKKELSSARRAAELFNNENGRSYENVCAEGAVNGVPSIYPIISKIATQYSYNLNIDTYTGSSARVTCNDTDAAWGAESPLRGGGFFCVDSIGNATTTSTSKLAASDYTCQ